jgi:hypothetical protein
VYGTHKYISHNSASTNKTSIISASALEFGSASQGNDSASSVLVPKVH